MEKNIMSMIARISDISSLQKDLATRNTYIDRMVANERRAFSDEEIKQYEENQKRIEICEKERVALKEAIRQKMEQDRKLVKELKQSDIKEPSILYMLATMESEKER